MNQLVSRLVSWLDKALGLSPPSFEASVRKRVLAERKQRPVIVSTSAKYNELAQEVFRTSGAYSHSRDDILSVQHLYLTDTMIVIGEQVDQELLHHAITNNLFGRIVFIVEKYNMELRDLNERYGLTLSELEQVQKHHRFAGDCLRDVMVRVHFSPNGGQYAT